LCRMCRRWRAMSPTTVRRARLPWFRSDGGVGAQTRACLASASRPPRASSRSSAAWRCPHPLPLPPPAGADGVAGSRCCSTSTW
jgi:hypothetical protein